MICEACQSPNPEGNRFCGNCGNPLALLCPNCSHSNSPGDKFCGQCGTALDAVATPVEAKAAPTSERRLVSVLFADLTGYTSYAEGRDAEDVRAFLSDYFDRSREVIERFGGIVEKFIGDAVMAVWGAETATEDDAELAVRAGLELVEVVDKLSADAGVPELALRVGVHTGEAAVGPADDHMGFVTGDLVNTASRLESAAQPGTVLVGEGTHTAANRSIVFEDVGAQSLKGKSLPVEAWRALRVVSERGGRGRADTLEPPFVGRTNELRLLKDMLESVGRESRSRLVSLVGEAGIGKSRLVWEFLKWIDGLAETIYWHEGRSPSYGDGVTFWAIAEMIKARAGIVEDDSDSVIVERLDEALETYVSDQSDREWMRPRLQPVLGVGTAPPGDRSELDAAIRMFFEAVSDEGTTVLVFEDLHWADTALIDFVDELTDWWRNRPILIVTMARTDLVDNRPDWGSARQGVVSLTLGPLSDREMSDVVSGTVPALPDDAVNLIVERSAGIPLYAVELLRGLIAAGSLEGEGGQYRVVGDVTDLALPESLHAVIGARLDRLDSEDRSLIQDAAILGHSFSINGLKAITGRDADDLEQALHRLSRRELIEPVRDPRSPERGQYRFLQGMIQEVAHGRMSRDVRRQRHMAVATFFESLQDPETAVVIASHYLDALDASQSPEEQAEVRTKAIDSLLAATLRARELRANEQVISIAESALEIGDSGDEKAPFWEAMVEAYMFLADNEGADKYGQQAIEHYRATGDREAEWRAIDSLAFAMANNNRPEAAVALLKPVVENADNLADSPVLAKAAINLARSSMLNANPADGWRWIDPALEAAERLEMAPEIVNGLTTKGTILGYEGRFTEGRILLEGAVELAEEHDLSEYLGRALNNLAYVQTGIDNEASVRIGEKAYDVAKRNGNRSFLLFHAGQKSQLRMIQGRFDEAREIFSDPLLENPPPAIRVWNESTEATIDLYLGEYESLQSHMSSARSFAKGVDDPQVLAVIPGLDAIDALLDGDLEKVLEISFEQMAQDWAAVQGYDNFSAGVIGLKRDRSLIGRWLELMEAHLPRFHYTYRVVNAISQTLDGNDRGNEVRSEIEENEESWPLWALDMRLAGAGLLEGEQAEAFFAEAREMCTERGWNGYLGLIEQHLG